LVPVRRASTDLFDRISENKHIMGLIEQHKGYCKYCRKLKDNIDRKGFDREFLEEKGSLERGYITSIRSQ
jgi:thioredoxin-related protein